MKRFTCCRLRCSVVSNHDNSLSERGVGAGVRGPVLADLSKKVILFFYDSLGLKCLKYHSNDMAEERTNII